MKITWYGTATIGIDDAFPPVTREVSVERLRNMIKKNHPDIEFIKPEICKTFEL